MPSGAGHDAMCVAALCPVAMLFVPSRGGVSHSPREFTEPEHCVNGARVLLGALLECDRQAGSTG
jgi:N-carbamoyl-L-amino-acid hydrolase